jgi:hypothetical protein
MKLDNRPEIIDGKPRITWFLSEDDGTFIRDCTQEDLNELNEAYRAAVLKFWSLPAGQLCEWGRPPLPKAVDSAP